MNSDEFSLGVMQRALAKPLQPEARARVEARIQRLQARLANPEPSQRVQLLAAQLAAEQKIPTGEATPVTLDTWMAELDAREAA